MSQQRVLKRTALLPCLVLILVPLSACGWDRKYVLKGLPVGDNRSIIILADDAPEISTGVFYEVKIGEETVVPTRLICNSATDPGSLDFKVVSASGGNLIGVYEESQPERVLVLHDFSKGITWPRGSAEKSDWENNTAGGKLLEELEKEHPDRKFKLNNQEACGVRASGSKS